MPTTVEQLVEILSLFFPRTYSARNALLALGAIGLLVPLIDLHNMQHRRRRQPQRTAWLDSVGTAFRGLFRKATLPDVNHGARREDLAALAALAADVEQVADLLDLSRNDAIPLLANPSFLLATEHRTCVICPEDDNAAPHVLYRHEEPQRVQVVLASFERRDAVLVSAHCRDCKTIYYPDRLSIRDPDDDSRTLRLEPDPAFIRISKPDKLWAHRELRQIQSSAFRNMYCGWSSFSKFVRESAASPKGTILNERQAKRMFAEHFGRHLLVSHRKISEFQCPVDPTTDELMESIVTMLGSGQGLAPDAMAHRCEECTHKKRYAPASQDPDAAAVPANHQQVLGVTAREQQQAMPLQPLPALPVPPSAPAAEHEDNGEETVVNIDKGARAAGARCAPGLSRRSVDCGTARPS